MSFNERQQLAKKSQILSSWSWFYLNSEANLQYSRYPKQSKLITDKGTGEFKRVTIIPYLGYSKRFEEDRAAAFKVGLQLKAVQERIKVIEEKFKKNNNRKWQR